MRLTNYDWGVLVSVFILGFMAWFAGPINAGSFITYFVIYLIIALIVNAIFKDNVW